jgi:hypothetical protein
MGLVIPGVLGQFDLQDAATAVAPRRLSIISPRDASGKPVNASAVRSEYQRAIRRYQDLKKPENLKIE